MKAKHVALFIIIAFAACKPKEVKNDLEIAVAPQDTTTQVIVQEPTPEPVNEVIDEGVNQDDKYFLIVNSYTIEEIAIEWNKVYRDKGYKSDLVMKNDDGYFRLALKSFDDLESAEKALKEMQQEDEFGKMWIMVK